MSATDWRQEKSVGTVERLVGFRLAETAYGLPIMQVREILRYSPPTSLPGTPAFVEGVLSVRGQTVPIVNLRARFGLPESVADSETRIVLCEVAEATVGFRVDSVTAILAAPAGGGVEEQASLASLREAGVERIAQVEEELVVVLDPQKLLQGGDLEELAGVLREKAVEADADQAKAVA